MDIITLAARLLLAAIFILAGVAKLADRAGSRRAMHDFGVPDPLAEPGAVVLPVLELAVAAALIPDGTALWGAIGASVLLLAFIGGIGRSMARGKAPDCHCFGQIYSEPAGWRTLVRNAVLLAVAGLIALQGRSDAGWSALQRIKHLTDGEWITVGAALISLAAIAVLGWLVWRLLGQVGRLTEMVKGLEEALQAMSAVVSREPEPSAEPGPARPPAPDFALARLAGEIETRDALLAAGKPLFLIFASAGCGPCTTALTEAARWQKDHGSTISVVPIIEGGVGAAAGKAAQLGLSDVFLHDSEVAAAYGALTLPSAAVVYADGSMGEVAVGPDAISALFRAAIRVLPPVESRAGGDADPLESSADANGLKSPPEPIMPAAVPVPAGIAAAELTSNGHRESALSLLTAEQASPLSPDSNGHEEHRAAATVHHESGGEGLLAAEEGSLQAVDTGGDAPDPTDEVTEANTIVSPAPEALETPTTATQAAANEPEATPPPAPAFALADLDGQTVTLDELRAPGKPVLLIFASAGCGPCTAALTEAGRWQAEHGSSLSIVPLILGTPEAAQAKAMVLGLSNVLVQDSDVAGAYGATMPSAVRVNPDGALGSEIARGPDAIRALFEEMAGIVSVAESAGTIGSVVAGETPTAGAHPAEGELLDRVRESVEYQPIRYRLANRDPVDSWQEDGLHFFVFQLLAPEGTHLPEPPTAVFVMRPQDEAPISAVVVAPREDQEPEIVDLSQAEGVSRLPSIVA